MPLGPRIVFSNAQVDRFGSYEGGPQGRVQNTFQYGDTLTWNRGAHAVKFGGDFFRYQGNSFFDAQTRGVYTFLNWDDFAAGRPNSYRAAPSAPRSAANRNWMQGAFAQDDLPRHVPLTLNLGVRLEVYGPVKRGQPALTSNLDFDCRDSMGLRGNRPLRLLRRSGETRSGSTATSSRAWVSPGTHGRARPCSAAATALVADFNFLNPVTNQRFLPPFVVTQTIAGMRQLHRRQYLGQPDRRAPPPIQQEGAGLTGSLRTDVLNYGDVNPAIDPAPEEPAGPPVEPRLSARTSRRASS